MSSLEELKERVRRLEERVRALEEEPDSLLTADDLRALKEAEEEYKKGESFSDVIDKLLEKRGFSLEDYFRCLKDSPALGKIAEYCRRIRESARFRI